MTVPIKTLNGVYKGFVSDNKDPKKQNRLKVTLQFFNTPKQTQKLPSTDWIDPVNLSGIDVLTPEIGQGIWVLFKSGDPAYPVWFGVFGKHLGKNKKIYIKPLENSVSLTGLTPYIKTTVINSDATDVDLTDTLIAMAQTLKNHEERITSLESQMATLHATLATRSAPLHTHGSNG